MTHTTADNLQSVVGRFAPSPTGPLHIGSLVAAMGSYLLAKQAGGRWLVRMEDLDLPRVVPGIADDQLRTLEALGFCWDGPVIWQSQRTEAYQAAFDRLLASGQVYPCGCSRAAIARAATAPHDGEGEVVYPGTCRYGLAPDMVPRAYRLQVADELIRFVDRVQGAQAYNLAEICGDFVIKRADGLFAYQLAVVVDDAAQGVTQVVRGADLLSSTPRQMLLQQRLGYSTPDYAHLPLIVDPGGGKLSKRNCQVSLQHGGIVQDNGWQLLARAASCLGCQIPADISGAPVRLLLEWLVEHFVPLSIPRGPLAVPLHINQDKQVTS